MYSEYIIDWAKIDIDAE